MQVAPPAGVTLLDLPLRIPLPAKIKHPRAPAASTCASACTDADEGYEMVTGLMQEALHELADERTLPVVG